MTSGRRYRLLAITGAFVLTAVAVGIANHPVTQAMVTVVPPLSNLQPSTYTNGDLIDEVLTTTVVVLAALWPLFKPRPRRILDVASETEKRVLLSATGLATIGYFDWSTRLPRTTLLATIAILGVVLPLWFVAIRRRPRSTSRAVLVGDDPGVLGEVFEHTAADVVGYVAPSAALPDVARTERAAGRADGGALAAPLAGLDRLGGLSRLDDVLVEHDVDTVLLAFARPDRAEFFGALATCYDHGVTAKVHREYADSVLTADVAGETLVEVDLEPWDWQDYLAKRLFDVVFAGVGLLALSPVVVVIALAIKLDSRGPVLYSQERTAEFGETFTIHKFRTMHPEGESATPVDDAENDRITRVGRLLRQTHLDEIPQLWAILTGRMSVVGPRAAWVEEEGHVERLTEAWRKRWFVKPGLTGLAQINGVTSTDPEAKLRYDLAYIRRQSFWYDAKVVLRQIWQVLADVARAVTGREADGEAASDDEDARAGRERI